MWCPDNIRYRVLHKTLQFSFSKSLVWRCLVRCSGDRHATSCAVFALSANLHRTSCSLSLAWPSFWPQLWFDIRVGTQYRDFRSFWPRRHPLWYILHGCAPLVIGSWNHGVRISVVYGVDSLSPITFPCLNSVWMRYRWNYHGPACSRPAGPAMGEGALWVLNTLMTVAFLTPNLFFLSVLSVINSTTCLRLT